MTPADPAPTRLTVEQYEALVANGQLRPDDRVELLEGVVVSMPPQSPPHGGAITRITRSLVTRFGDRATVRIQLDFLAGPLSIPQPDFAVVPNSPDDYSSRHPDRAHLVIEVAHSSLPTDRLTKAAIYAAAGVPQYLIINLPGDRIEEFAMPNRAKARYVEARIAHRGDTIVLRDFPDIRLAASDLLPVTATRT